MIIFIAAVVGIAAGIFMPYNLTSSTLPYVAIALLAAIDSVFGGISANLKRKFNMNIFMMGFFSNAILAVLLTYIGDLLGINFSFAAVIVFGTRIFSNLATIRYLLVDRFAHKKENARRRYRNQHPILAIEGKYDDFDDFDDLDDLDNLDNLDDLDDLNKDAESENKE